MRHSAGEVTGGWVRGAGEESGTGPSPDVEPLTDVYGTDAITQSHLQLHGRRFRFDMLPLIFKSRDSWSFFFFGPFIVTSVSKLVTN